MRIDSGKLGSLSAMSTVVPEGVQRGVLGGSVAFVAPDDSLAWLDEDDAFPQTGDNLLKS
jgi:hypothetical protein